MRTYEKKIDELGKEIADDIINKANDPKWEIILDQNSVARSLANIYDKGLKKVYEDLDSSVRKNLYRMRNNN